MSQVEQQVEAFGAESRTACRRCGRAVLGGDGNPEARIMRRARQGNCVDCCVVVFLQQLENLYGQDPMRLLPSGMTWATALSLPHMQEQFAVMMNRGRADANPDEIDWHRVIELWDAAPRETASLR